MCGKEKKNNPTLWNYFIHCPNTPFFILRYPSIRISAATEEAFELLEEEAAADAVVVLLWLLEEVEVVVKVSLVFIFEYYKLWFIMNVLVRIKFGSIVPEKKTEKKLVF